MRDLGIELGAWWCLGRGCVPLQPQTTLVCAPVHPAAAPSVAACAGPCSYAAHTFRPPPRDLPAARPTVPPVAGNDAALVASGSWESTVPFSATSLAVVRTRIAWGCLGRAIGIDNSKPRGSERRRLAGEHVQYDHQSNAIPHAARKCLAWRWHRSNAICASRVVLEPDKIGVGAELQPRLTGSMSRSETVRSKPPDAL